jgi:hypothetical protein
MNCARWSWLSAPLPALSAVYPTSTEKPTAATVAVYRYQPGVPRRAARPSTATTFVRPTTSPMRWRRAGPVLTMLISPDAYQSGSWSIMRRSERAAMPRADAGPPSTSTTRIPMSRLPGVCPSRASKTKW